MSTIKVFNRWGTEGIKIDDEGLVNYITIQPTIVPRTGARYIGSRFHKSRVFIIERLMNKLMIPGHKARKHFKSSYTMSGKGNTAYSLIYNTLELIEKKTKENPVKVVVKALENAAPREEIVTIEYGGARYPKAVECAPQRRVDLAMRYMVQGAYSKAFNSKRSITETLADEILNAANLNSASNAISRKLDIERQADTSR